MHDIVNKSPQGFYNFCLIIILKEREQNLNSLIKLNISGHFLDFKYFKDLWPFVWIV